MESYLKITQGHKSTRALMICVFVIVFGLACGVNAGTGTDANMTELKSSAETDVRDLNSVAVTVNGVDITEGEIEALIKPQLERMAAQPSQLPAAFVEQYKNQLRQQALERMIVEKLLDKEVKAAKIVVVDEEVVKYIEKMASQQKLSLEEFKALITASGKSFDEWKQQMQFGKGLGFQKLMEAQWAGKINVTEGDAEKYYAENRTQYITPEQVRASHILITPDTTDPNTDPNQANALAKAKAGDLLKQVKEGADFTELARANSTCPSSVRGGDLSFFRRGQMVPAFEKAAFGLEVGEVSGIVETQFGYHIIKTTDHKDPNTITFEQAKEGIIQMLTQTKQREIAMQYIESLKAKANIVYPPGKEPKSDEPIFPGAAERK